MGDKITVRCHRCGQENTFDSNETSIICEWCNGTVTKEIIYENQTLLDAGTKYRNDGQFEKAEEKYDELLRKDPNSYKAQWGKVLNKYGVVYVERNYDEQSEGKKVITCRKRVEQDILKDYESLKDMIPEDEREEIEKDADTIALIQNKIKEYNNYPCDVFLCYKETDAEGRRTYDSKHAQTLYWWLKSKGFENVFFARVTLENKAGADYEALIFRAIESAEIMVVLGTNRDYFTSTWVKNEWSRYLRLLEDGENKMIIPICREITDIPKELSDHHFQAIMMNDSNEYDQLLSIVQRRLHPEPLTNKSVAGLSEIAREKLQEGMYLYDEKHTEDAIQCLKEVESQGSEIAAYLLGSIYYKDIPNGKRSAFELFKKAADSGNADAMFQVGFMYEFGIGVKKNTSKAKVYYDMAHTISDYPSQSL